MDKLNKNEIIEIVAEATHFSKVDTKKIIDATFELIADSLLDGQSVNIKNFCVFEPKTKSGRKGTHPKKHTVIDIKAKNTVTIHLAKEFKERLNED